MLHVTVTTVERRVFDEDKVVKITLPTSEGEITVLPEHIALMTVLGIGEVKIEIEDQKEPQYLFVDGGIVQVANDQVELLANMAEQADELDEAKIEEAKRRAEKLLEENPIDVDLAQAEAALQRELTKLKIARKRRTSPRGV